MVCVVVRLGPGWEGAVGSPEVDQRLHRLQLLRLQHVEGAGCQDKVAEAAVELFLQVEVVEGIDKVGPVEVGVDSEHLAEDGLADLDEFLGKAAPLPDPVPVARAAQLRERRCGDGGIMGEGDPVRVRWKDAEVINLTRDPALHEGDVLVCGQFHGLVSVIQPSERMIAGT